MSISSALLFQLPGPIFDEVEPHLATPHTFNYTVPKPGHPGEYVSYQFIIPLEVFEFVSGCPPTDEIKLPASEGYSVKVLDDMIIVKRKVSVGLSLRTFCFVVGRSEERGLEFFFTVTLATRCPSTFIVEYKESSTGKFKLTDNRYYVAQMLVRNPHRREKYQVDLMKAGTEIRFCPLNASTFDLPPTSSFLHIFSS